jgi:hypothetical protein
MSAKTLVLSGPGKIHQANDLHRQTIATLKKTE